MSWLRWQLGRQGTGYWKMLLATGKWPLPFDIYALRYPPGSEIGFHIDPVQQGFRHYRLNIILKRGIGGVFWTVDTDKKRKEHKGRFNLFRPDITPHGVSTVFLKSRIVLSIGWLIKD